MATVPYKGTAMGMGTTIITMSAMAIITTKHRLGRA